MSFDFMYNERQGFTLLRGFLRHYIDLNLIRILWGD